MTDDDSDGASVHQILGFGFYSDPDPDRRGFYVDEVSFSDMERRLNSTNVRLIYESSNPKHPVSQAENCVHIVVYTVLHFRTVFVDIHFSALY